MLKLPKGLKKKKKGKKSKKNQELFTEEELEAYKREQREKQLAAEGTSEKPPAEDDEWLKFKSLTSGIDTVLKKTQGDLDRIKESSFYQRVPTTSEKKEIQDQRDTEERRVESVRLEEEESAEKARLKELEEDRFAQAVVELSESEEESEEGDDIFDTAYIDALTSGDVQLAYVPESPLEEEAVGPDPFDTSYAEKVIKGPEVSKRGKAIVNIGSAVEVLTGRVEKFTSTSVSRRPRRGPQNLLLESFDDGTAGGTNQLESEVTQAPIKTLLDDFTDDISDVPIDLSVSLHLQFQKEKADQKPAERGEEATGAGEVFQTSDLVSEFDVLKTDENDDEDDEFAELAAESLTKREEVQHISEVQRLDFTGDVTSTDWAAFDEQKGAKAKPARPPPPRAITETSASAPPSNAVGIVNVDDVTSIDDDPFDTTFVEKAFPNKEEDDDFDFDPRADELSATPIVAPISKPKPPAPPPPPKPEPIDLLSEPNVELESLAHVATIVPTESFDQGIDIDPFDTSSISYIVQPKATEIKFLEKELLSDIGLKHSLSDPDFDPRAEEPVVEIKLDYDATARRKSSLSLNISGGAPLKSVAFNSDLLGCSISSGSKIQKPLTPYYSQQIIEDKDAEDPFDTSFVPSNNPSKIELNLLERDLLQDSKLKHSLSDPDFDPRAVTPVAPPPVQSDLLGVHGEEHNIKVLTPAINEQRSVVADSIDSYSDPFDTSAIDHNILPGKTELKLIENELLPRTDFDSRATVLDSYTDSQELGLGDRVLTPQIPLQASLSIEEQDPFDTSIANNLRPGKTEIKILESELIHQ